MGTKRKVSETDPEPGENAVVDDTDTPNSSSNHQPIEKKRRLGQKARKNLKSAVSTNLEPIGSPAKTVAKPVADVYDPPVMSEACESVGKKRRLGQKARKILASSSAGVSKVNANGREEINEKNLGSDHIVGRHNGVQSKKYTNDMEQDDNDSGRSEIPVEENNDPHFVTKSKSSIPPGIALAKRRKTDVGVVSIQPSKNTFYFTNNTQNTENIEDVPKVVDENNDDEPEEQEAENDSNSNSDNLPFKSVTFHAKLGSPDTLAVLKRFIKQMEAVNDDGSDVLSSETIANVRAVKILEVLDPNLEGKLANACIVFNALHVLIMRSLTDTPILKLNCEEACRNLLNDYLPMIERMLTDKASVGQLKVVFKLLTVVISMTAVFGHDILSRLNIPNSVIERVTQTGAASTGLRKTFIHFVMSFFIEKNAPVICKLMEKKELLSSIIPGLIEDEAPTVYLVLTTFRTGLFEDWGLRSTKGKKLAVFTIRNIVALIKLLSDWKGPKKVNTVTSLLSAWSSAAEEADPEDDEDKKVVTDAAYQLLEVMCTSRKMGIIFNVPAFGLLKEKDNWLMSKVLSEVHQPWAHKELRKLVAKILVACPDLIKVVMRNVSDTVAQHKGTPSWIQAVDFVREVVEEMSPSATLRAQLHELTLHQVTYGVLLMCMPFPAVDVFQAHTLLRVGSEERHVALRLLLAIMKKTREFCDALDEWGKFPNKRARFMVLNSVAKSYPQEAVIWKSWEKFVNPPDEDKELDGDCGIVSEHVICVLDVLMRYQLRRPLKFKFGGQTWGPGILLLIADVEGMALTDDEEDGYQKSTVQLKLFDLLFLVSHTVIQENKAAFTESLDLLLRLTSHPSPTVSDRATALLVKFLSATAVFTGLSAEVVVWLNCYESMPPPDKPAARQLILDALALALKHPTKYRKAVCDAEKKAVGVGDSNKDCDPGKSSLSPMLPCISEAISEMSEDAFEKIYVFINLVVIKLLYTQHSPAFLSHLIDEKYLDASVCEYMRNWLGSESLGKWTPMAAPFNPEGVEYKLSVSILGLDNLAPIDVIKSEGALEEDDSIQNMLLFNLTMFHLTRMISLGELSKERKEKCAEAITTLLSIQTDLTKKKECIQNLFAHPVLLKSFAPLRIDDEASNSVTDFIVSCIQCPDICWETDNLKDLVVPFKEKLIRAIVAELSQDKSTLEKPTDDRFNRLLETVRSFRLDFKDIVEILDVLKNFKTKDLLANGMLSVWGLLLVELLQRTVSLHEKDRTLSGSLPKRIVSGISNHLKNMLTTDSTCAEAVEESLAVYLKRFPQSVADLRRDLFLALLNSPRTKDDIGLLILSREPNVFGKILSKSAQENNIIMEQVNTVFSYATAAFVWNTPLFNKPNRFLKSLYDVHEEKIIKGIKKPKKVKKWMKDNGVLIIKLINGYMSAETCDELCEDVKQNAKKHSSCDEVQLALLECIFVKRSRTKGECVFADFSNFLLVLLVLTSSNEKTNIDGICLLLCKYVKQVTDSSAWDSLKRGPIWRQFKINALKLGLESLSTDFDNALLLQTLAECIKFVYKEKEAPEEISTLLQMTMSHSQFLTVMLSTKPSKLRLVELLSVLVSKNPSAMSQSHVPILFSAYNATLSLADQQLLRLLKTYETSRVSLHKCRPYLWGEAAVNLYCITANRPPSLDYQPSMAEVVQVIDVGIVQETITKFPLDRKLNLEEYEDLPDVYDPAFFLPLFGYLLAPESVVDYLKFIHSGGLAMTLACLSSSSNSIRAAAYYVLSSFHFHIEALQHNKDKLWWLQFINTFRNGIVKLDSPDEVPRIPCIITTFMARMSLVISEPMNINFLSLSHFLMATFALNLRNVPNFLTLLYNTDRNAKEQRHWILAVIRDGLRTTSDWHLCTQSFLSNHLLGYYSSSLAAWDEESKILILQVLNSATKVPDVARKLVRFSGFFPWLHETIRALSPTDKGHINAVIQIVKTMQASHPSNDQEPKQVTRSYNVNITLMVISLLPKLPLGMNVSQFKTYLTVFEAANSEHNLATRECIETLLKFSKHILGPVGDCEDLLQFGNKFTGVERPAKGSGDVLEEAKGCLRRIVVASLVDSNNKEVEENAREKLSQDQ